MLVKSDLFVRIYQPILEEISRGSDDTINNAIALAEAEVKAYLSRFDIDTLFASNDVFLKNLCVSVAAYKICILANPSIDQATIRQDYEDTIDILTKIMNGKMVPQGWPYHVQSETPVDGNAISSSSNTKLEHGF